MFFLQTNRSWHIRVEREVIDQLRVQLELKTGEIIEARDRVSTLEASTVNLVRAAGDRRLEQEWSEKITETTERFFALDKRVTESSDKTLLLTAELEEKNLELIRLQSQMDGLKEEWVNSKKSTSIANFLIFLEFKRQMSDLEIPRQHL